MIRALGISGSPRRGGNVEILLDKTLLGARDAGAKVEKIILNNLKFRPCQECGGCYKTGICILRDDFRQTYDKIDKADVLIIASPIFFTSISAQTKMMIDRLQSRWVSTNLLSKPHSDSIKKGAFISVCAAQRLDFFDCAKKIIKAAFTTIGAEYSEELFLKGIESKGQVKRAKGALKKAYILGKNLLR